MTDINTHLNNRKLVASALAGEIFGPNSSLDSSLPNYMKESTELDITRAVVFQS